MTTFNQQFNELVKATLSENNQTDNSNQNIQDIDESAKRQDFFRDNNTVAIGKRYTTTRIKSRKFVSNISYVGINKEDYYDENFIFDVYLLTFSLHRKLADKNKHEMIYMLWKEWMPAKSYRHICKEKNFLYLNSKNVLQPKLLETITDFINKSNDKAFKADFKTLRNNLSSYKNISQCVYSNVFPKIYCSTEKQGFDFKSNFHISFKKIGKFPGKKSRELWTIRNETNIYDQKPVNIDDLNEVKEKEVKERVKRRKEKRRDVAEKNKLLKEKRKLEENKTKE